MLLLLGYRQVGDSSDRGGTIGATAVDASVDTNHFPGAKTGLRPEASRGKRRSGRTRQRGRARDSCSGG